MNAGKRICAEGNGVHEDNPAFQVYDAERFFTPMELEALGHAIVSRGKRKGRWLESDRPFGTPGYVCQQARTMAFNPHRMPSQAIMLFDAEQRSLFWSLTNKFEYLRDHPEFRTAVSVDIQRRFS